MSQQKATIEDENGNKVPNFIEQEAMGHTPHNLHIVSTPPFVLADPGAIGLISFSMTAIMLAYVLMVWVPGTEAAFVLVPLAHALVYGGIMQIIAGVLELIKGNTFGGTVFCSYGCFWICLYTLHILSWKFPNIGNAAAQKKGMALHFALYGLLSFGFLVISLRKNMCLVLIFTDIVISFGLLAGGQYDANVNKAAGYFVGLVGLLGLYTAFASMLKTNGIVLPGIEPIRLI